MEWESPWGTGFPGWHIECSAMSRKHLGEQIDIHTGGADLIPVHHTNEIAQSEAASGKSPFVRMWVHGQFIMVDGQKMSKSKGNFYCLADIEKKGIDPLALRYLYMTAHYRSFLNFTWEGLGAASQALKTLRERCSEFEKSEGSASGEWNNKFIHALEDDLNMPQALAVVWDVVKSKISSSEKYALLMKFDEVLGLDLKKEIRVEIPDEIRKLSDSRDALRNKKMFKEADAVRKEIEKKGYTVEDSSEGPILSPVR